MNRRGFLKVLATGLTALGVATLPPLASAQFGTAPFQPPGGRPRLKKGAPPKPKTKKKREPAPKKKRPPIAKKKRQAAL
ncbi:MAG: twin-arginine translocation signal domain-containing protein [Isosphaeraceae bacterium]